MEGIIKIKFDSYKDIAECPKCNSLTESDEDGFICLKCQLFNICKNCNDGTLLYLKAWGELYNDSEYVNDPDYENFNFKNENENPKYYATSNDPEAMTDHSKYLWYCPLCNKEETTS